MGLAMGFGVHGVLAVTNILVDETTGLEILQRTALEILHNELNDQLASVETTSQVEDAAFFASMNQVTRIITLEPIADANFFSGHKPSLIERGPDFFPSVSVMAYGSAAGGDTGIDQTYGVANKIAVETLVKAGFWPDGDISGEGETLVNARIQRTTDAVLYVLAHNRTLNGLIAPITDTPQVLISEVFAVVEERSGKWYWQGSRIDLVVTRQSQIFQ